jgi:type I restriction enzyme S subunit
LSDADALIESLEQLLTKKRRLKQGAMQELLTGKIRLRAFANTSVYKQTEVGGIPQDWNSSSIGDIAIKVGSGVTPKGGNTNYRDYGRPFVRSQNVGWGTLLLSDLAYIDDATHHSFAATELRNDDVLLNITGASIGRCAVADMRVAGGNVNQHVCIIRVEPDRIAARYIGYLLLSNLGQRQIDSFQAGGNREGLNFGQIRSIKIPLPPTKAEQTAIAAILSDMDAEITALEAKLAKARHIKQGMMQELLTGRIRLV